MTVVELAELVKILEEKFGVSAAAMAVGGGATAGAGEAAIEKTSFDVILKVFGEQKSMLLRLSKKPLGLA